MTLGEQLRTLRKSRGLTLIEVSRRCKPPLTWQAIARIEKGYRQPGSETLQIIAGALNIEFHFTPTGVWIGEK